MERSGVVTSIFYRFPFRQAFLGIDGTICHFFSTNGCLSMHSSSSMSLSVLMAGRIFRQKSKSDVIHVCPVSHGSHFFLSGPPSSIVSVPHLTTLSPVVGQFIPQGKMYGRLLVMPEVSTIVLMVVLW